jgi:hypothetical protein
MLPSSVLPFNEIGTTGAITSRAKSNWETDSHRILGGLRDDSGIFRKWRRIFMRAKVERMKSAL